MFRGRILEWLRWSLLIAGCLTLGYTGAEWASGRIEQAKASRELDRILFEQAAKSEPPAAKYIADGSLIGKVEIPDLHLSAVVFQGTSDAVLNRGVGHMDGTALPGHTGNVVLAAHRDTYFRDLRNIRPGEEITFLTENGAKKYRVNSTEIVAPNEMRVAAPTTDNELTLITCYPFYFVGHAPKRFIVHARAITTGPSAPLSTAGLTPAENQRARKPAPSEPAPGRHYQENSADLTYIVRVSP